MVTTWSFSIATLPVIGVVSCGLNNQSSPNPEYPNNPDNGNNNGSTPELPFYLKLMIQKSLKHFLN